jgi:hypothetical protein
VRRNWQPGLRRSVQTACMIGDENSVPRLVAIDRRQMLLRTLDVEKLVEDDRCVRAIWELVPTKKFGPATSHLITGPL